MIGALLWPYLSASFEAEERLARIVAHYAVIDTLGPPFPFDCDERLVLVDLGEVLPGLRLVLDQPIWFLREGGLVLNLFIDSFRAFSIAFSLRREADGELTAWIGGIQGRNRDDMIAGLQERGQRAVDGGHAGGGGEGVLRPLDGGDAFFEHPDRGVAVAGVDEFVGAGFDEPRLGLFGGVVDKALGQEDRLGHFAILAAARARMHQFRPRLPVRHRLSSDNKKPPPEREGVRLLPASTFLFSGLFYVARNPENKSPRGLE